MTYNEWRDELKSNLLSVTESERRRVLDYYAEAYADRRDAGFSEREIIQDFGAPYDAAQRILTENSYGDFYDSPKSYEPSREDRRREERERREREREEREREREEREREREREERDRRERERERREREREERERERDEREREREARERERRAREEREREREREERDRERREREERARREAAARDYGRDEYYQYPPAPQTETRGDYTWIFVLLCILFAVPIGLVLTGMVIATVVLSVAPVCAVISGAVAVGTGVAELFTSASSGAISIGLGLVAFGAGIILMPICFRLVKWMWKLFHLFFAGLKRLFSGKKAHA